MSRRLRLGVLISGRGSNLSAVIDASRDGKVDADVCVVISNKAEAKGLSIATSASIPAVAIDPKNYPDIAQYEKEISTYLDQYKVDLVVLAGYMKIVGPTLIENYTIINIHPSLLPAFKGLEAQKQALEAGVSVSGCTVHFVNETLDSGPIILQREVSLMSTDTVDSLSQRILAVEHELLPEAIQLFCQNKVDFLTSKK